MILLVLVVTSSAFGTAQAPLIERVAWLQGCWQGTLGAATIEEQWMTPRGGTMLGMGRTVRANAIASYELILLKEENGRLAYEAHPSGQPSATFVAQTVAGNSVVFENAAHDFPQRVGYRLEASDSLAAWIEGVDRGKPRRIEYTYRRVMCERP